MGDLVNADILPRGHVVNNRFEIEKALGIGGMGAVYLARDTLLEGSPVALKVLHSHLTKNEDLYKRFLHEVKLMHQVNHRNVVRTYDIGNDGDTAYFTMEFVEGTPFDKVLKKGQMPIREGLKILQQVAEGLQAIHDCQIVHRDLKPANIMILNDGVVKITDFGVARPDNSDLTEHDSLIGTMAYMAPEIMLGKETTTSVDIYSLGVITYLALTGEVPFKADTPAQLVMMHVKKSPVPPRKMRAELPNWTNRLILSMLAKTVKERPKNAGVIAETIRTNVDKVEGPGSDTDDSKVSQRNRVFTPTNVASRGSDQMHSDRSRRSAPRPRSANPSSRGHRHGSGRSRAYSSVSDTTTINTRKLLRHYWPILIIVAGGVIFLGLLGLIWAQELIAWGSFQLEKFLNSL